MHIVPAPAESLMKSRVLSIPGVKGVSAFLFSILFYFGDYLALFSTICNYLARIVLAPFTISIILTLFSMTFSLFIFILGLFSIILALFGTI